MNCIEFLEALNHLFENGLLSHESVKSVSAKPIQSIRQGFSFFQRWYTQLESCDDFVPSSPREKRFIAFQTFDMLRMAVYGFISYCELFLQKFPQNYVIPFRANGSAIETVFSQAKERSHGDFSSAKYSSLIRSLHVTSDVDIRSKNRALSVYSKNILGLIGLDK